MAYTNGHRLRWLEDRVNFIAGQIEVQNKQQAYLDYLASIQSGTKRAEAVDESAWETFLPLERDKFLLAYYHTIRTELLELLRKRDEQGSRSSIARWLDDPWTRAILAAATLASAAEVILHLARQSGLLLRTPEGSDLG